ncbi:MAG: CRISPR-associated endonuclease Cas1 [Acaryochloris sp. RU_4_1]|nr:CRISPR-associated endonuclease Cas1 [Acaryochloris sp. RU_4_1]NJR55413.1 CRISPR-associated endonuclease Cas1 [Acaryochloris sp. CRU_2_0]
MPFHLRITADQVIETVDDRLILSTPDHPDPQYLPLTQIKAIQVFGDTYIATGVIQRLLHHKIPTTFFDRHGKFLGRLEPKTSKSTALIRAQVQLSDDHRLQIYRAIIHTCLKQRRSLLQRASRDRNINLTPQIEEMANLLRYFNPKFPKLHPTSIDACRGYFGSGMQIYWGVFPELLNAPFPWRSRQGNSPANLMLEFLYSLLQDAIWNALEASALDPWLGITRSPHHSSPFPPLAMDLATEFQIYAEALVLRAVNRGQIAVKDFAGCEGRLPAIACTTLAELFDYKMAESFTHPVIQERCTYQEAIAIQVSLYADFLLGKREYVPLLLK